MLASELTKKQRKSLNAVLTMKMASKRKNKRKIVTAEERSHFNLVKTGSPYL